MVTSLSTSTLIQTLDFWYFSNRSLTVGRLVGQWPGWGVMGCYGHSNPGHISTSIPCQRTKGRMFRVRYSKRGPRWSRLRTRDQAFCIPRSNPDPFWPSEVLGQLNPLPKILIHRTVHQI